MKLIEEQALERRERILEATRQFIAEHGAMDLTIRDLARACRVSVPTLYRTFGSKQDLLAEPQPCEIQNMIRHLQIPLLAGSRLLPHSRICQSPVVLTNPKS